MCELIDRAALQQEYNSDAYHRGFADAQEKGVASWDASRQSVSTTRNYFDGFLDGLTEQIGDA